MAARAQTIDASARGAVCVSQLAGTRARVGNVVQPGSHVSCVGELLCPLVSPLGTALAHTLVAAMLSDGLVSQPFGTRSTDGNSV